MGNLRFPLLEAYRSTSRADLARQRLAIGEVVFSTNKCNFIKLTDKEYLGFSTVVSNLFKST